MNAAALWRLPPSALRRLLREGHPLDEADLAGQAFRGTAIGPELAARLTWRTFQKVFWHHAPTGRLLGWNVRLEQDGVDAPSRPRVRGGRPYTTGHFEVLRPRGVPFPDGFDRGLILDYARGNNPRLDPLRWVKDPLVSVRAGDRDLLLGVSYLAGLGRCVVTPTWFTLEREGPLTHVPPEAL